MTETPGGRPGRQEPGLHLSGPSERPGGFVLTLEGEFDLAGVPAFDEAAGRVPASGRLVVDLRELGYMDSSGVAALLRAEARLREAGGELGCVVGPGGGSVWRLFELTSLSDLIQVFEDLPG